MFENDRSDDRNQIAGNGIHAEHEPIDTGKADGVYFKMDEAEYHALPRLSASGIKNVLTSIPTFWAKSWMNKDDAEEDDAEEDDSTQAQILGRAYHVAIFEPDELDSRYAGEPDLTGIKNLLTSDTAVCAELKALGQTQKKSGESSAMRALRLMEIEPSFEVKSVIMGEWRERLGDRQAIGARYWAQLLDDCKRIKENPEIDELVTGGASEVTILWTCPESGIPMKARIDKLKADKFVDLKSFANANGKPVGQVIMEAVQYYKYYLSMRVYQTAIAMIREQNLSIRDMPSDDNLQDNDSFPPQWQVDLRMALHDRTTPLQPWLFFQEKGGVPNLLARKLKLQVYPEGVDVQAIGAEDHDISEHNSALCRKADIEIAHAKQQYLMALEIYGEDQPWYPLDMIGEMGDADFRDWFLDSMPA